MLVRARSDAGDLPGALAAADEIATRARNAGDRPGELRALVARGRVAHLAEAAGAQGERLLIDDALGVFEAVADDRGLAETWGLAAMAELSALQWRAMAFAVDRSLEHAERVGDRILFEEAKLGRIPARLYGPFPVEEGLAFLDANPMPVPFFYSMRGQLEAMRGNFDEARRLVAAGRERADELGHRLISAGMSMQEEEVELQRRKR